MRRNYSDPVYTEWRRRVRRRDKNKCQMPGCNCKRRLQAHHIVGWASATSLRYEVDNGITLCYDHHKEVTGHEQLYEGLFRGIVRKNNGK